MKRNRIVVAAALLLMVSCGEQANQSANGSESSEVIDMSGPQVEVNVVSFSVENGNTEIEVINRTEESIISVSGRLVFLDENDSPLKTATGRQLDSPFQYAATPSVVGSASKKTVSLGNTIKEGTVSIRVEEVSAKTASGQTIN